MDLPVSPHRLLDPIEEQMGNLMGRLLMGPLGLWVVLGLPWAPTLRGTLKPPPMDPERTPGPPQESPPLAHGSP